MKRLRHSSPLLRIWRFRTPWLVAILLVVVNFLGWMTTWEHSWRSQVVAVSRALTPVIPDPTDPDIPICIVFASHGEDPARIFPTEGRVSTDPVEMTARMALLMAGLASLPREEAPRVIAIDMTFPVVYPGTTEYLAAAIAANSNVVLAATEVTGSDKGPILRSHELIRMGAVGEGMDTFSLPAWASPGSQARLYATGFDSSLGIPGLGAGAAGLFAGREMPLPRQFPIHYWNLYPPMDTGDEGSTWADDPTLLNLGTPDELIGIWPTRGAHEILAHVPHWEQGEDPTGWLNRVQTALNAADDFGMTAVDVIAPMLEDRLVLIGSGHPFDLNPTPFTMPLFRDPSRQGNNPPMAPGVVLHAMAAATLIKGNAPTDPSLLIPGLSILLLLLGGIIGWVFGTMADGPLAPLAGFAAMITIMGGDFLLTHAMSVWLPTMGFLLAFMLCFVSGVTESRLLFSRSHRRLTDIVRRFTPPGTLLVYNEEDGSYMESYAGGEARPPDTAWRTAMIIDIAGYTPMLRFFQQQNRTEVAAQLIGDFFQRVIGTLDRHDGNLSDLTGDGLAAIFDGSTPEDQARRAVACASEILKEVDDWRKTIATEVLKLDEKKLNIVPGLRIGIAGSETQVRFFGSARQQRSVYFGGAFVLAARVEQTIKKLPRPTEEIGNMRVVMEVTIGDYVSGTLPPGLTTIHHGYVNVQGVEQPVGMMELVARPQREEDMESSDLTTDTGTGTWE